MSEKSLRLIAPIVSLASVCYFGIRVGLGSEHQVVLSRVNSLAQPFQYQEYKVLFTNPVCKEYRYPDDEVIFSQDGDVLTSKPKNAYCSSDDYEASASRPESPQYQLERWISDPATREIFLSSFSFSNRNIRDALCNAIESRGVKLTVVLDSGTSHELAQSLETCTYSSGGESISPTLLFRGNQSGLGFAHNKFLIVNPNEETMKVAFGSGNFSSGTVLHHENWHFVTAQRSQYFMQSHLCMRDALLDHSESRSMYRDFIETCKANISTIEESDIKTLFIPGEGEKAEQLIFSAMENSERIYVAAHRFSHRKLLNKMKQVLNTDGRQVDMRLVVDDDVYWVGQGLPPFGGNSRNEFLNVESLQNAGLNVRYVETNGSQNLYHHNKFVLSLDSEGGGSVFTGAGNLSNAAFRSNLENFYFISIPEVVSAFEKQYEYLWELGTSQNDLPEGNALPER